MSSLENRMKLSIALATYNGEKYLQEQLDSLLAQTVQPDEVVISDDRSTDRTIEIAKEFQKRAPFDVIVHQNEQQKGFIKNFDKALSLTSGDLVFLCDQDDVWFEHKLETIRDTAIKHPEYSVYMNDALLTDGQLNRTDLTVQQQIQGLGRPLTQFITGCCAAIRRSHLDKVMPLPDDYPSHDGWIINLADALREKWIISDVLQLYRRHGNNTSNSTHGQLRKMTRFDTVKTMVRRIQTNGEEVSLRHDERKLQVLLKQEKNLVELMNASQRNHLLQYLKKKRQYVQFQHKRLKIRELPFHKRVLCIQKNYVNQNYDQILGYKSALRDLLGSKVSQRDGHE